MSTLTTTRADLQQLADVRLEEAEALLDAGKWDGAYYLAGYAVEIALKACIIKLLMATDAFPDRKFSEKCYTHKLLDLLPLAGLQTVWNAAMTDRRFSDNWDVVEAWSEQKRYHRMLEVEARKLYDAITDPAHGVLPWIKTHW